MRYNETATITLSNASNASISDSTATLTITDDDAAPSLSIADVTAGNENAANSTFTVSLSAASEKDITVDYATSNGTATAGSDYTATSGTLTILQVQHLEHLMSQFYLLTRLMRLMKQQL